MFPRPGHLIAFTYVLLGWLIAQPVFLFEEVAGRPTWLGAFLDAWITTQCDSMDRMEATYGFRRDR